MSKSTTISRRVLSLPTQHDVVIFAQKQQYVMRFSGIVKVRILSEHHRLAQNRAQIVDSVVRVELDEEGRIVKLVDEWCGRPLSSNWLELALRRLSGRIVPCVPWLSSAPTIATA